VAFDTDVFILGGGPAGLAAAIATRRKGFRVMVADARQPPIDKACGEGLLPDALEEAGRLGIEIPAEAGFPFRGIRFVSPRHSVAARFPAGAGLGIRRTTLHQLMVDRAEREGVELLWNTTVSDIEDNRVLLGSRELSACWIVGADGAQSRVRRWTGLDAVAHESLRFGFRRHFRVAPWSEFVELHWGDRRQFYVTPVASDEVGVVLMTREPGVRLEDALPGFPELHARLKGCEPASTERGAVSGTRRLRNVAHGNVALIGDASGTVDPITGEGLRLAFLQAAALAEAFCTGNLAHYQREHRRIATRPLRMAKLLLMLDRWPGMRARAIPALRRRPGLFADFLAMHVGRLSFGRAALQLPVSLVQNFYDV
jgi:menaquinone-9 beta-reductase